MNLPKIVLCGRDEAEVIWTRDAEREKPKVTHIISIREPSERNRIPKNLEKHPAKQLRLVFHDIPFDISPSENMGKGARSCTRGQIRRLLWFTRQVPEDGVVLIHCAAGISRSPAATLVFLAARLGEGKEVEAVRHLLKLRRTFPNPRVVYLGDELLGRDGRLFRAFRDVYWTSEDCDYDRAFPQERLRA